MKKMMISFFTRTPLHVGCGSSVGAIDLPVLRERATDLPVIPGSTLKGVLADLFLEKKEDENGKTKLIRSADGIDLFGNDDTNDDTKDDKKNATRGKLMVGEARLVAFPVRSAKGGFVWATSPLLLARLGIPCPDVEEMKGYGSKKVAFDGAAFILEEYKIERKGDVTGEVINQLATLCDLPLWTTTLADRLVILSDTMLTYFAKNACEIAHHNKIDDETGVVAGTALFSQENVPSEALFVGEVLAREQKDIETLQEKIVKKGNLLQVGANATTGLGWCQITMGAIECLNKAK